MATKISIESIPPRTRVIIPVWPLTEDKKPLYRCIDCDLSTYDLEEMIKHQEHPDIRHRIRRAILR